MTGKEIERTVGIWAVSGVLGYGLAKLCFGIYRHPLLYFMIVVPLALWGWAAGAYDGAIEFGIGLASFVCFFLMIVAVPTFFRGAHFAALGIVFLVAVIASMAGAMQQGHQQSLAQLRAQDEAQVAPCGYREPILGTDGCLARREASLDALRAARKHPHVAAQQTVPSPPVDYTGLREGLTGIAAIVVFCWIVWRIGRWIVRMAQGSRWGRERRFWKSVAAAEARNHAYR